MVFSEAPSPLADDARQVAVLDAAVGVFGRFGYRKTSMDEVARAAGISRQGLYLQFANKEELFRKAVAHTFNNQLQSATALLARADSDLERNLIAACEAWSGRHVGAQGTDAADLMCASTSLAGATLTHYESRFEAALARAIEGSPLARHCVAAGVLPGELARAVHATARGFKYSCKSKDEFVRGMTVAVRMLCVPLHQRPV